MESISGWREELGKTGRSSSSASSPSFYFIFFSSFNEWTWFVRDNIAKLKGNITSDLKKLLSDSFCSIFGQTSACDPMTKTVLQLATYIQGLRLNPEDKWALAGCLHTEGPVFKDTRCGITSTTPVPPSSFSTRIRLNYLLLTLSKRGSTLKGRKGDAWRRRASIHASEGRLIFSSDAPQKYIRI